MINLNKTVIIQGVNKYGWEGDTPSKTFKFNIINGIGLLTDEIISNIVNFKENIYFNETSYKHYFLDFKAGQKNNKNVWVESLNIDSVNMTIDIGLFQ